MNTNNNESTIKSPLVTIITICYNAEKELPMTMESVLAQDYDNFEYVIEDGNSTDSTPDIVNTYLPQFEARGINVIYNRMPDKGIYDAMNKAVDSSSGCWINFMNAGDCFYSSTVLSSIFGYNNYESSTILFGDCVESEFGNFNLFLKQPDNIEDVMPFSHQATFAKLDFLKEHPFNLDYRYSADYDFLLTAHCLGERFTDVSCIICITNKDGVSSVNYHDMLMESAQILKSHNIYHHSDDELRKIEKTLKLKQFVLDHFPIFIKKAIRTYQINKRGQALVADPPPWFKSY